MFAVFGSVWGFLGCRVGCVRYKHEQQHKAKITFSMPKCAGWTSEAHTAAQLHAQTHASPPGGSILFGPTLGGSDHGECMPKRPKRSNRVRERVRLKITADCRLVLYYMHRLVHPVGVEVCRTFSLFAYFASVITSTMYHGDSGTRPLSPQCRLLFRSSQFTEF